jgi:hypothetical protein
MLMTRFVYLCATVFVLAFNIAALISVARAAQPSQAIVSGALILNSVAWPLGLIVAYRVGQITGVEFWRKGRAASGFPPSRKAV